MKKIIFGVIVATLSLADASAQRYIIESPDARHKLYLIDEYREDICVINSDSYIEVFNEHEADNKIQWVSDPKDATMAVFISNGPTDLRRCEFLRGETHYLKKELSRLFKESYQEDPYLEEDYAKTNIPKSIYQVSRDYEFSADLNSPHLARLIKDMANEAKETNDRICQSRFGEPLSSLQKIFSIKLHRQSKSGRNSLNVEYMITCHFKKSPIKIPKQSFKETERTGFLNRKSTRCKLESGINEEYDTVGFSLYGNKEEGVNHYVFNSELFKRDIVKENPSCSTGNCEFKLYGLTKGFNVLEGTITNNKVEFTHFQDSDYEKTGQLLSIFSLGLFNTGERTTRSVSCSKTEPEAEAEDSHIYERPER